MNRSKLLLILALGAALRLAAFARALSEPAVLAGGDTQEYLDLARSIVHTGVFEAQSSRPLPPGSVRTPGYPFLLAGSLVLFGNSLLPPIIAQIILSVINIWLAAVLAEKIGAGRRMAALAAIILALDPESIIFSITLMSETLFTTLLLLTILLSHRLLNRPAVAQALYLAALSAALILTRPIAEYLPLAVAALGSTGISAPVGRRLLLATTYLLACGLLLAPWLWRNQQRYDFPNLTTVQGFNVLYYNAAMAVSKAQSRDIDAVEDSLTAVLATRLPHDRVSVGRRVHEMQKLGVETILAHLPTYLLLHARGMLALLIDPGRVDLQRVWMGSSGSTSLLNIFTSQGLLQGARMLLRESPAFVALLAGVFLWYLVLFSLSIAGGISTWRILPRREFTLIVSVILYFLLITGPIGAARFRVPLAPLLALFSAQGLLWSVRYLRLVRARPHREITNVRGDGAGSAL